MGVEERLNVHTVGEQCEHKCICSMGCIVMFINICGHILITLYITQQPYLLKTQNFSFGLPVATFAKFV